MTKTRNIHIRVSEAEHARFALVAQHYGISVAAAMCMLAKRESDDIGSRSTRPDMRRNVKPM